MLFRLTFRQLFRFCGACVSLRLQMLRRQERDSASLLHATTSFKRTQGTVEPIDGIRSRRAGDDLHLMDMAAFCAPQRPVLEPGSRTGNPLHHGRPLQSSHSELDKTLDEGEAICAAQTFLISHEIA